MKEDYMLTRARTPLPTPGLIFQIQKPKKPIGYMFDDPRAPIYSEKDLDFTAKMNSLIADWNAKGLKCSSVECDRETGLETRYHETAKRTHYAEFSEAILLHSLAPYFDDEVDYETREFTLRWRDFLIVSERMQMLPFELLAYHTYQKYSLEHPALEDPELGLPPFSWSSGIIDSNVPAFRIGETCPLSRQLNSCVSLAAQVMLVKSFHE
jgi:hypothetical protein